MRLPRDLRRSGWLTPCTTFSLYDLYDLCVGKIPKQKN